MLRQYFDKYLNDRPIFNPDDITNEIAFEKSPERLAYLFHLKGNAYLSHGQYRNALNDFNIALRWNSHFSQAYKDRGDTYLATGAFSKAINDYNQALECDYLVYIDVYCNRGHAYSELGKTSQAIADYCKSLTVNKHSKASFYLENILTNSYNGELDSVSKRDIFNAIKLFPEKKQMTLLRFCLTLQRPLGRRMWKSEFPYTGCNYNTGTLKDICVHLESIDPTFINPGATVSQQSIFNNPNHLKKPELTREDSTEFRYQLKFI